LCLRLQATAKSCAKRSNTQQAAIEEIPVLIIAADHTRRKTVARSKLEHATYNPAFRKQTSTKRRATGS
jgi:hypothetical protein